ncbi:hypothetical protein QE152_g8617 [Popillia japonica]|uniref:Uncharacterized protein n=1 Tax=Popillia japonica TaxID=7064 RepID=A0AAW1M349_POPJA
MSDDRGKREKASGSIYRSRTGSEGTIADFLKRKREEAQTEQTDKHIFNSSKKIQRSPIKSISDKTSLETARSTRTFEEMEEFKTMITPMFQELKKEIKSNNEQMTKNNEDIVKLREELKERDEKM